MDMGSFCLFVLNHLKPISKFLIDPGFPVQEKHLPPLRKVDFCF
jgi:hypothetical protein